MVGRAKLTINKKIEIKALLDYGISQHRGATALSISKKCVYNVSKKLKNNLPLSNTSGQGRERASTAVEDRNLLRLCKKDRTKSSEILSSELKLSNSKHSPARICHCRLPTMSYKSYRAKKKPLRTPAHKKQRLLFVSEHQCWCREWNNITWSDEAHFEVFNTKHCTFVRRRRSEYDQPFNFPPKVQGGGGGGGCVSVWGCIADGARCSLVIYSGKLNEGTYVKVNEEVLPLFIENTFDSSNPNWMFMHDCAPSHRSKYTLKWFENKGIEIIKWPAVSPDFNPIENLWDLIDKKIEKNRANQC